MSFGVLVPIMLPYVFSCIASHVIWIVSVLCLMRSSTDSTVFLLRATKLTVESCTAPLTSLSSGSFPGPGVGFTIFLFFLAQDVGLHSVFAFLIQAQDVSGPSLGSSICYAWPGLMVSCFLYRTCILSLL